MYSSSAWLSVRTGRGEHELNTRTKKHVSSCATDAIRCARFVLLSIEIKCANVVGWGRDGVCVRVCVCVRACVCNCAEFTQHGLSFVAPVTNHSFGKGHR